MSMLAFSISWSFHSHFDHVWNAVCDSYKLPDFQFKQPCTLSVRPVLIRLLFTFCLKLIFWMFNPKLWKKQADDTFVLNGIDLRSTNPWLAGGQLLILPFLCILVYHPPASELKIPACYKFSISAVVPSFSEWYLNVLLPLACTDCEEGRKGLAM